jgi:hypothetical protein
MTREAPVLLMAQDVAVIVTGRGIRWIEIDELVWLGGQVKDIYPR